MTNSRLTGKIKRLVDALNIDRTNYVASFAYGSVVFPQKDKTSNNSLIDLILIVRNPVEWHRKNISDNPNHYNFLFRNYAKHQSSYLDMFLSRSSGPKVYYNPFIEWNDPFDNTRLSFKYGVVALDSLLTDLLNWSHLYLAGRLQKPVLWIPTNSDIFSFQSYNEQLYAAQNKNLLASMSYAILQNYPENFPLSEYDLFCAISSISYIGDWRMIIGEDRQKIQRLVSGKSRLSEFRSLYNDSFKSLQSYGFSLKSSSKSNLCDNELYCLQSFNKESESVFQLLKNIPNHICLLSVKDTYIYNPDDARTFLSNLSYTDRNQRLRGTVFNIVRKSSLYQTGLGLFSAGPRRSLRYALAKLSKMFASLGFTKWS
ncbi:Phosphatidate cytidylyltransferase [Schistosoma japonicum]|uniref:Phosphatidate cytidylyltransferase, mitochondrial n=1 Tax=Schistosoma japonicum TaxID=6182 RepID=C1L4F3_SCHJA|nr:Phosphatidate cytidylyltransferase [Schistosoma japonicum]CAX69581.1 MMP37-like protein, mitochondrial precursor [Schistosoma japonicum]